MWPVSPRRGRWRSSRSDDLWLISKSKTFICIARVITRLVKSRRGNGMRLEEWATLLIGGKEYIPIKKNPVTSIQLALVN
jgi:hypothetical protein